MTVHLENAARTRQVRNHEAGVPARLDTIDGLPENGSASVGPFRIKLRRQNRYSVPVTGGPPGYFGGLIIRRSKVLAAPYMGDSDVPGKHPAEPIRWRSPIALGGTFMVYGSGEGFKVILTMRKRERQVNEIKRWACTGDQEMTPGYGEYVRYAAHVAAMAEQNAAWVARIEKLADQWDTDAIGRVLPGIPASLRSLLKEVDDGE